MRISTLVSALGASILLLTCGHWIARGCLAAEQPLAAATGDAAKRGRDVTLENSRLRLTIDGASGGVVRIVNKLSGETYEVLCQPFRLRATFAEITAADCRVAAVQQTEAGLAVDYEKGPARIRLRYTLVPGAQFFEKRVEVRRSDGAPFGIVALGMERMRVAGAPCRVTKGFCTGGRSYNLFYDVCPTAMFVRVGQGGMVLGVENPLFQMETDGTEHRLWYNVGLKIEAGQTYVSEPEFVAVYRLSGKTYRYEEFKPGTSWVRPLFALPPSPDHTVMDWAEIEAMQQCVQSRSPAYSPGCITALNNWAGENHTENWDQYRQVLQSASKLGIRSLIFADAFGLGEPGPGEASFGSKDEWRNPRRDPQIGRVLLDARPLGLKLGGYFSPSDRGGSRWTSDHLSNARRDWIIERSDAVIRKYDIGWWGNDFMQFNPVDPAKEHGHITPEGGLYMQWRNLCEVYRQIRKRHPDVNIGLFGGLTSCGPWSLEDADYANLPGEDSHDYSFCPFPDIHINHLFGNEERLRSWYGHNLLFYPPYKCRFSVGHLGQDGLHVWGDPTGWKTSFLGAIGTSTILEYAYIPIGAELTDEHVAFVRHWIGWANRNIKYLRVRKDLFGEPAIGRVDGYAHIIKDRGFIFCFNPNHRPIAVKFPLDEWIGLTEGKTFLIKELYPREGLVHAVDHDRGLAVYGRDVTLNVPPQGVQILEIAPYEGGPVLFGVAGALRIGPQGNIELTDLKAEEGEQVAAAVRVPSSAGELWLDGKPIPNRESPQGLLVSRLRFKGEPIQRQLARWVADGEAVPIPNVREYSLVKLTCRFHLPAKVSQILAAHKSAQKIDTSRIPTLDPSRLLVTLPTTYPETVDGLRAWLNGAPVAVRRFTASITGRLFCHYLDITDLANCGGDNELVLELPGLQKGQFLGGYLENLPVQASRFATAVEPGNASPFEEPVGKPLEAFR